MKTPRKKNVSVVKDLSHVREIFETLGFNEFAEYLRKPWRIVWINFVAGISRGFGIVLGATVVLALFVWLLGLFIDFPLVGQYFSNLKQILEQASNIQN